MSKVESIKSRKKRKDELDRTIEQIHTFYERYCKELNFDPNDRIQNLSNEKERETGKKYFTSRTDSLRREISTYIKLGHTEEEALTRVLPKAYGLVRAASAFLWNKPHYDVQLKGGILLNQGYASEMATGEGKTLTATLPTYLNALLGKGAHVITPNGYLAKRDCEEMSELYELLGLSCRLAEERISISQEAIMDKTIGILAPEIGLHTLYARNEEERQTITKKFISDKKNKTIVEKARAKAIEALRKEETLRRRKAYEADITYGSSATFAFDYLRDDIENDPNKTVQRKGTPNFAVIDEVDAVLFDDATTPFTLSGEQTDIELAITDEEKNDKTRNANKANLAIARINNESKKIIERNGDKSQALISYVVNDDDKFKAILNNETESANFQDMTRAIIINDNTQEYKLTTLGEIMMFQFYCDGDINKILKENLSKIVEMKFDNGPMYREGLDYVINEYGRIEIEPRAFAHLVISETIPDLSKRFHQFHSNELIRYRNEIDNAIKAWYILKEDVEYVLTVPKNAKDPNERMVSLVMNGRTAEGRVYSNGLQQAIENKIKYQKQIPIRETKIKSTLASIPTASFFARYSKFGGMTGTSADNAFRNLYGLETREVERNKPRQVIDHGERLYPNTEDKYEAIFQEVLKSYKKGQPVLLSTTSIEESERLNIYLTNRLQQYDGQFKIGTIKVLNANVNQLEEEAAIVSKAGLPKMITIATEMAGRGTDIKLGGEVPDIEELVSIVENELVSKSIINLKKIQPITQQNESYIQSQIRKKISSDRKTLVAIAQQRQEILKEHRSELRRKVEEAGGLKVIGCGHFPYSRVDQQVKGRCGRQGDPGEVIFFNDPSDLLKVGVPKEKVEFFAEQAKLSPIIEDPKTKRTPISDVVYAAQRKTETLTEMAIKNNQEVESQVARFRRNLRTQKEMIQQQGDYIDTMEYLIEETVKSVIKGSSKDENPHLTDKTRLNAANLDFEELTSLSREFLGVEISQSEIKNFKTLNELREYVTSLSLDLFQHKVKTEGKQQVIEECKESIDKMYGRVWTGFEELVDTIKYQDHLNKVGQYQSGMSIEHQISLAYLHSVETERGCVVREIVNPNYKTQSKDETRQEITPVRVTPHGLEKVAKDFNCKQMEIIEEFVEQEEQKVGSSISNLQIGARFFTFVNKVKINRDSRKVGTNYLKSDMESVDFGDAGPDKNRK